mgnify:CR=1 FL=1
MNSELFYRLISIIFLFIIAEVTAYFGILSLLRKKHKTIIFTYVRRYWLFTIVFVVIVFPLFFYTAFTKGGSIEILRYNFFIAAIIILVYLTKLLIGLSWLFSILLFFIINSINKILLKNNEIVNNINIKIQYILNFLGLILSIVLAIVIIYGMSYGTSDFKIKNIEIEFDNLPHDFDGFKIIQISDTHLGSFNRPYLVKKGLKYISLNKPDLIVFTGDLINVDPLEAAEYVEMFNELKPPYGKYAVLGNHDMDDFFKWELNNVNSDSSTGDKVTYILSKMGFITLRNQSDIIHKGQDSIAITGIDSWGKPPFKKYADINKAIKGFNTVKFKILLSHNPEVLENNILPYYNFDLTLSGHTHAMQMGFNFNKVKWSPASLKYKYYMVLYKIKNSYLYVNQGFGYIGFSARIGLYPEITVITLKRK